MCEGEEVGQTRREEAATRSVSDCVNSMLLVDLDVLCTCTMKYFCVQVQQELGFGNEVNLLLATLLASSYIYVADRPGPPS